MGMRADGESTVAIAAALGRSIQSVNGRIQYLFAHGLLTQRYTTARERAVITPGVARVAPSGPSAAEVFAPLDAQPEDDETFLARFLHTADTSVAKALAQRHATIRIAADQPVAVSLTSDWHIAPANTDMRGLIQYANLVRTTPRLYALAVGDLHDNPIKHKGGSPAQVADELRALDLVVGRFGGKLLGMTSGNHDDWSVTLAGVDNLAALARRHRMHYAPDELLWQIQIVDPADTDTVTATYHIFTRHQWRRGSALNPGHACWTWWQEEGPNWAVIPDVLAIGHNHQAVVETRSFAERDMWALRMGSWQVDSTYARARGFARYRATCPTVVLPPTREQRIQCFADPDAAVQFMAGANVPLVQPVTQEEEVPYAD
jgi:hypothetical protein